MSDFRLQRLDHVSLNAGDRPRSIAWYRDVLGLRPRNEPTQDGEPVFMGDFGACIALFQAQSAAVAGVDYESVGLRHIAFMLGRADFERVQTRLGEEGVDFRHENHGNARSIYIADPDGNVVELTTYEL